MVPNEEDDAVIFSAVAATTGPSSTSTLTSVSASVTTVTVLALNNGRKGATIYNDAAAILYLALGSGASVTNFTAKLFSETYYEVPYEYLGIITGIWNVATGAARVTELT
jgi:hypothetical protein